MDPNQRNTNCRRHVRARLALTMPNAFPAEKIRERVNEEEQTDYDAAEIAAALGFLVSLNQVETFDDPLGSKKYYRATAAGVLAHERKQ